MISPIDEVKESVSFFGILVVVSISVN